MDRPEDERRESNLYGRCGGRGSELATQVAGGWSRAWELRRRSHVPEKIVRTMSFRPVVVSVGLEAGTSKDDLGISSPNSVQNQTMSSEVSSKRTPQFFQKCQRSNP